MVTSFTGRVGLLYRSEHQRLQLLEILRELEIEHAYLYTNTYRYLKHKETEIDKLFSI